MFISCINAILYILLIQQVPTTQPAIIHNKVETGRLVRQAENQAVEMLKDGRLNKKKIVHEMSPLKDQICTFRCRFKYVEEGNNDQCYILADIPAYLSRHYKAEFKKIEDYNLWNQNAHHEVYLYPPTSYTLTENIPAYLTVVVKIRSVTIQERRGHEIAWPQLIIHADILQCDALTIDEMITGEQKPQVVDTQPADWQLLDEWCLEVNVTPKTIRIKNCEPLPIDILSIEINDQYRYDAPQEGQNVQSGKTLELPLNKFISPNGNFKYEKGELVIVVATPNGEREIIVE
ncbi:MAG: hypothetical protein HJJLKODD_02166 [Phycisphaerae bacterium]|nr:hypothetical protein [Phycisphaerae bacterium]